MTWDQLAGDDGVFCLEHTAGKVLCNGLSAEVQVA